MLPRCVGDGATGRVLFVVSPTISILKKKTLVPLVRNPKKFGRAKSFLDTRRPTTAYPHKKSMVFFRGQNGHHMTHETAAKVSPLSLPKIVERVVSFVRSNHVTKTKI